ncbi:MAG TPA: phage tail tape measure protein [Atlantibacter hermannii]|uniref:phage tail tape measure C-terminal domain-containing protein n=1 Tax=Atlantibacter hermannii TaxID=565 RepID=UPI000EE0338B|nr:phage tail tape measure C-terminal domain-containing protein [Atlantibacter hermannii]HCC10156.1 phage tail tape measure protein [Atlantibacter hermannii]
MAADVASLAVALHLNAATFKSQFADAMRTADSNAQQFNRKAQEEAKKTRDAFQNMGKGVAVLDADFNRLGNTVDKRLTGLDEMRNVLASITAGSTVGGSSIITALISAMGEGMSTALGNSMSKLEAQRQAQILNTSAQVDAIRASIENARRLREEAQARAAIAVKTIEAARADRERAFSLDEFFAKQAEVNKLYGVTANYQDEHAKNARTIEEANRAEAAGKDSLAEAAKTVLESDIAESEGKQKLIEKTREAINASAGLSLGQRAAAASAGLLRGALAMVGGPIGLGLLAAAGAATALYTAYANSEAEIKGYTLALQKSGQLTVMNAQYLRSLSASLGDADKSIKAVTSAVAAGFGGDLLVQVADLGVRMDEVGLSSDDLVSMLSSLKGDPLQAMQKLTDQGILLNESMIDQIVTLERQGKTSEATALLQQFAMQELDKQIKAQEEDVGMLEGAWKSLKGFVSDAFTTMGQAHIAQAEAIAAAQGIDLNPTPDPAIKAREEAEKAFQLQQKQRAEVTERLKTENTLAGILKAGVPREKERAEAIALVNANFKKGTAEYEQAMRGVEKMYAEHKQKREKAYTDDAATRRLQDLRQEEVSLRAQNAQTENLTNSERKLVQFNQEMADLKEKRILTAAQRSLLANEKELRAQLEINASLDRANAQRQIGLQMQEKNQELYRSTLQLQQEYSNAVAQMTMSTAAYDQMVAEQGVRERFAKLREDRDKEITDHLSAEYKKQTALLLAEEQKQLQIIKSYSREKQKAHEDAASGFKRAMSDWLDESMDVNKQIYAVTQNTMSGMGDMVWKFASTGKADFKSFATSVLNDIGQMISRMLVAQTIKSGISAMGWGASFGFAEGGYTGDGGKHDVAGVVHRGEWVVPQEVVKKPGMLNFLNQLTYGNGYADGGLVGGGAGRPSGQSGSVAASGNGGVSLAISIPINVIQQGNNESQQDQQSSREQALFSSGVKTQVKQYVMEVLDRELGNGGMIDLRVRGG